MRRSALICVALLLVVGAMSAQAMLQTIVNFQSSAVAPYSGPADVATLTNCWSLRACTSAIAVGGTVNAVQITRASDSHNCKFLALATGLGNSNNCSNGGDNGQSVATFLTSTTGTVLLNDQIGPAGFATTGSIPYAASIIGSLPAMGPVTGANVMNVGVTHVTKPYTYYGVAERIGSTTSFNIIYEDTGASATFSQLRFQNAVNTVAALDTGGTISGTATDNKWHFVLGVFNGSSPNSIMNLDGAETTGTTTSTEGGSGKIMGDGTSLPLNGYAVEFGRYAGGMSSGNRTALCKNVQAFWGASNFGTAC